MAEPFHLRVLAPTETLLDARDVASVQVGLADGGAIGIFPGHAPLLAETVAAPVRYSDAGGEHTLDVAAGILEIAGNAITILASRPVPAAASESGPTSDTEVLRFERLAQAVLGRMDARDTSPSAPSPVTDNPATSEQDIAGRAGRSGDGGA